MGVSPTPPMAQAGYFKNFSGFFYLNIDYIPMYPIFIIMNRVNKWRKENPEKRREQRKRDEVRSSLRKLGILPLPNEDMSADQRKIYEQIGNNDFSFWVELNEIKKRKGRIVSRAKESGRECDIDITDIEIPEYCSYLNIRLSTDKKDCYKDNYYSIDRIDSSKGYVKGNIQIISRLANTMKNNATIEQLLIFAENIKRLYGVNPI